jgi:hypothetical protein
MPGDAAFALHFAFLNSETWGRNGLSSTGMPERDTKSCSRKTSKSSVAGTCSRAIQPIWLRFQDPGQVQVKSTGTKRATDSAQLVGAFER